MTKGEQRIIANIWLGVTVLLPAERMLEGWITLIIGAGFLISSMLLHEP